MGVDPPLLVEAPPPPRDAPELAPTPGVGRLDLAMSDIGRSGTALDGRGMPEVRVLPDGGGVDCDVAENVANVPMPPPPVDAPEPALTPRAGAR
jgi:hypothetical protein